MSPTKQLPRVARSAQAESATSPRTRYTDEQIRHRAYEIFLSRQREEVPGDPVSDWVRAEQELRNRLR
jgi:hypothetical protein